MLTLMRLLTLFTLSLMLGACVGYVTPGYRSTYSGHAVRPSYHAAGLPTRIYVEPARIIRLTKPAVHSVHLAMPQLRCQAPPTKWQRPKVRLDRHRNQQERSRW